MPIDQPPGIASEQITGPKQPTKAYVEQVKSEDNPLNRTPEKYLAQQKEKQKNQLESHIIKEVISPKEVENVKKFMSGFQSRLGSGQLKGGDVLCFKEVVVPTQGNNQKTRAAVKTIFPGQEGYSKQEWLNGQMAPKRFGDKLTKEERDDIANAEIISITKFHREKGYGIPWESYAVVVKNKKNNNQSTLYLLELPDDGEQITLDYTDINGKKTVTRY